MSASFETAPLFLAVAEIATFTEYKLPTHQTKRLRAKGWRFELNDNRKPTIARKYAEKMLGYDSVDEPSRPQPNFNVLRTA